MNTWNPQKYAEIQARYQYKYGVELLEKAIGVYGGLPAGSALDVGCGEGSLANHLSALLPAGNRVHGIDADSGMVKLAKNRFPHIAFFKADAIGWLEEIDETYTFIFSNAVLHWLKTENRLGRFAAALKLRMAYGGHAALRFSLQENGRAAKAFLSKGLQEFLQNPDAAIEGPEFDYKAACGIFETHFPLLFRQENRYCPFEDEPVLSFEWMIKSQPIQRYLPQQKQQKFAEYLFKEWKKNPVPVEAHQCTLII